MPDEFARTYGGHDRVERWETKQSPAAARPFALLKVQLYS